MKAGAVLFGVERKGSKAWPKTLFLGKEDPAESILKVIAEEIAATLSVVPTTPLDPILKPLRENFDRFQAGQGESGHLPDPAVQMELNEAKKMLPDSYDLCSCASGRKYKFCCKLIFREIIEAMSASEEGDFGRALKRMDKAKDIVDETAVVLCRYAIIYHHKSENEWLAFLGRALEVNPKHPRSHYLFGIHFKGKVNTIKRHCPTKLL